MNAGETSSQNFFRRHINYAISVLEKYDGREPFHLYLKKYFAQNKKHGSKDRKQIAAICYDYYRVGMGVSPSISISEKLLVSTFLIEKKASSILEALRPGWNQTDLDLSGKIEMVKGVFSLEKLFPFNNELSDEIDFERFSLSFLIQPKLFIRIRPGYKKVVLQKLNSANISYEELNDNCLAFLNNEKVSDVINIDKEAVIQDYNSQQTLNLFTHDPVNIFHHTCAWDCCAASGGKSILLNDLIKNIDLTVTDTRKSILENLRRRFAKAGIKSYQSSVADISVSIEEKMKEKFNLVIADVPCSGSGTWSRTPEQLIFFEEKKIGEYSNLQKQIVLNAMKGLCDHGYLLYITCSVFKKENEENVAYFQDNLNLKLIESKYFKGYEMQADTLFAALFIKS